MLSPELVDKQVTLGDRLPLTRLSLCSGKSLAIPALKPVVFIFYPGDFTPICTRQWCHYRQFYQQQEEKSMVIVGVTSGLSKRHEEFRHAYRLPFEFVADEADALIYAFRMKSRFGYVKRGVAVIDTKGVLRYCKTNTFLYPSFDQLEHIIQGVRT